MKENQRRNMDSGIKVNNILTALVLGAVIWVGTSILQIKEAVIVNVTKIGYFESALRDHIHDDIHK